MRLKKKITISIVFFLILSILFFALVIYPIFSEIKKSPQNFLSQKEKLLALEEKAKNLEKFKKILPEISPDLEKIDNFFVDPKVPVDFISFLEKTSQDSQLSLKISAGPIVKNEKDPWPSMVFQLSLVGSFPNLAKFLEKLQSGPYLIEIQNFTITSLSEAELKSKEFEKFSLGDVKATLSIKVYSK